MTLTWNLLHCLLAVPITEAYSIKEFGISAIPNYQLLCWLGGAIYLELNRDLFRRSSRLDKIIFFLFCGDLAIIALVIRNIWNLTHHNTQRTQHNNTAQPYAITKQFLDEENEKC